MRTLMKLTLDIDAGNQAALDGTLPKVIGETLEILKAEAAYFLPESGERTAYIIFDMQDAAQIPVIAEPLFQQLKAKIELSPVMNADDLRKGLEQASQS